MKKQSCSVIILAGGKSSRMNFPKPYLHLDETTFLGKISDVYHQGGVSKIILVLNSEFCDGKWGNIFEKHQSKFTTVIRNDNPELGRFHSLKLGLKPILDDDFCFIQNVDSPFIHPEVIHELWKSRSADGYTSPVFQGRGGHPILLSKHIIHEINTMQEGDFSLKKILSAYKKNEVQMEDDKVLLNVNTQQDYLKLMDKTLAL